MEVNPNDPLLSEPLLLPTTTTTSYNNQPQRPFEQDKGATVLRQRQPQQQQITQHDVGQYLRLKAPENLPAGHTFPVKTQDGEYLMATVPEGGVTKNEVFTILRPDPNSDEINNKAILMARGEWIDGLFACCTHGLCHPALLNAMCCVQIATSQIMTRMNLNMFAKQLDSSGYYSSSTCPNVTFSVVVYCMLYISINIIASFYPSAVYGIFGLYAICILYTIYIIAKTRSIVRRMHRIAGGCLEDLCCAFCCTCCTVAQMARHTGDYHLYRGAFCSATGMEQDGGLDQPPRYDGMMEQRYPMEEVVFDDDDNVGGKGQII